MAGPRVAVVGAGAWGTTLARVVARMEPVTLLCHSPETAARIAATGRNEARLPGIDLPPTVIADRRPERAARRHRPGHLRGAVGAPADDRRDASRRFLAPEADLLSVVKGLERGTLLRMSEVIAEAAGVPIGRVAALSGPNLAAEVARNLPASAVVAAADLELAERVAARVARRRFRLYVNEDILGVELCGALKNVVAIAAGAADGLGFGDNGKAGLLTRGLAEMTRLGIAAGANPLTFAGLAGMGDLIATVRLAPVAQPPTRRGARQGPHVGRDRGDAARDGRGRLHGPGGAGPGRALRRRDADRPRGRTAPCSRARASSAAWSTCWPANRRTSWPTTAAGSSAWRPTARADASGG